MALITEVEVDLSHLVGGSGPGAPAPRTVGVHVSSIIKYLHGKTDEVIARRKEIDALPEDERRKAYTYWEMGFAWEQIIADILGPRMFSRRIVVDQEEIEVDGILMNPDAYSIPDQTGEEYKATWRSAKNVSDLEGNFWPWFAQMKAYAYGLKTLKYRLFVYFVNGNWQPPVPMVRRFDITFSPRELELNWKMILQGRDDMIKKGLI